MPVYQYKGVNAGGKKAAGIIDADSPKLARQKLKKIDVFPIDIWEQARASSAAAATGRFAALKERIKKSSFFATVSKKELAMMTRQFATLVTAGIPIVGSLNALTEQ